MKRLDEHTNEELVALDEDQITGLINTECAYQGAPLMSVTAPVPPVQPDVTPDAKCFMVNYGELRFATMDEAQKMCDAINSTRRLDTEGIGRHSWRSPFQLVPSDKEASATTEQHWTGAHYRRHQAELEKFETDKEVFNKAHSEFRKQREARDMVLQAVTARIDNARGEHRDKARLRAQFEEYCTLAEGNVSLALTFLLKATPHDEAFVRTTLGDRLTIKEEVLEHGIEEE